MKDTKKAYYAVIPANVRYDKAIISGAKLLYGELTALCNEKGFCWATNKYFADLYEIDPRTIRRWVQSLAYAGYIQVDIVNEIERKIYILEGGQKRPRGRTKKSMGGGQKSPHNNTSNNTKKIAEASSAWVWKDWIQTLHDSSRRELQVIALFFEEKKLTFDTKAKSESALRRHLRSAVEVSKFDDDEILGAIDRLKKDFPNYTIETIHKQLTK